MSQAQQPPGGSAGVPMESPSLVTTSLLACSIVFPTIATTSIIVRVYCRRMKSQTLKADDWVIVLALLMSWAQSINVYVAAGKAGVDTTTLPPLEAARTFLLCLWIEGIPLSICLTAIKISILLFYNRIFTIRPFRRSVYIAITILIAWGISSVICQILAGDPVDSVWNPLVLTLRYNYRAFSLAVAGMSLIFDVLVLCFPLPVIRTLNMPTRRKLSIIGIFWLGGFCCISAALRLYFLQAPPAGKSYKTTTQSFIWAYIEPNVSILAACLPTYGPLFTDGGPTFITNLQSRLSSLISRGSVSSAKKPWGNSASNNNSNPPSSNFSGKGRKPGSSVDEDGEELMLQERSGPGKTASRSWMKLDNNGGSLHTEITGGRHGGMPERRERDLECGIRTGAHQSKPLGVVVTKGMKIEEFRANVDK